MPNTRSKQVQKRARHLLNQTAHRVEHHGISIAARLMIGLAALIALGTALLMLPGVGATRQLTFNEALFTSTSALTVTGLSIITPAVDLSTAGQVLLLVLIQIGGVGFMFVAVIALQLIGRRIYIQDRLALTSSLGLDSAEKILGLLKRVLVGIFIIEAIGAMLLWVAWQPYLPPSKALGYAIFHAISSFCNAGFDLFNGATDINGVPFDGLPHDSFTILIIGAIILIGGLGIPVLSELFTLKQRRQFSLNTRITLLAMVVLTLFGWLAIYISETSTGGVLANESGTGQVMRSLFQSISNRTAGFSGLPDFGRLRAATLLLIIAMMFIGCAPASMGGGITTGTFSVLLISFGSYVRGKNKAELWGRSISSTTVRRASAILTLALALLFVATWLILISHPELTLGEALFEVASAFATCGLSLGTTAKLNGFGRIVIMFVMFWGRLGPLTTVIALAQRRDQNPNLVRYPEEQVLIG